MPEVGWLVGQLVSYIVSGEERLSKYSDKLHQKEICVNDQLYIIISIQPEGRFWQEPEPSQTTGMALAHCILGSFLGVGCLCFSPPLDVPTFASRCLHVQAT